MALEPIVEDSTMITRTARGLLSFALPALLLIIGFATSSPVLADEESMRIASSLLEREMRAWNVEGKNDLTLLTSDVDIINAAGPHWHGRETAGANGQNVLDTRRPTLNGTVISAERLAPNIILVISRGTATMPEGAPGPREFALHQLRVLAKVGDQWLVRAITSTPIR